MSPMSSVVSRRHCHQKCSSFQKLAHTGLHAFRTVGGRLRIKPKQSPDNSSSITTPGGCATFTVSNSVIHAGAFGTRWSAIASICAGPCGRLRTPCSQPLRGACGGGYAASWHPFESCAFFGAFSTRARCSSNCIPVRARLYCTA